MDLVGALSATDGVVCVVGAGGKKSTLYTLAGLIDRAVVTATVRIPIFDRQVARVVETDDPARAIRENDQWPLGVVPEREREDRYPGYDSDTIGEIAATDEPDAVLVKADGARTRNLKAPNDREPQLPDAADVVLPIASAHVVGKSLTEEWVHRPERVAAITGLEVGETMTAVDVATVLAHDDGGMKDAPEGACVIPVVNKVDDDELATTARDIATEIHRRVDVPRVVLTQMNGSDPLVEVVDSPV